MKQINCTYCGNEFTPRQEKNVLRFCSRRCKGFFFSRRDKYIPPTRKGIVAWNKELNGFNSGVYNGVWKGDKVTYRPLHSWVSRMLGTPNKCSFCSKTAIGHGMHWANKSGDYKRDLEDWIRLCAKCHKNYDLNRV